MDRSWTQHRKYLRWLASVSKSDERPEETCEFCLIDEGHPQLVRQTKYFKFIHNRFPYTTWDHQYVTDHLMIVPRAHTDNIATLPQVAMAEYVRLTSEYELDGYNIYSRATRSVRRTMPHQHTHLIKCNGRQVRMLFYFRKPHARVAL